MKRLYRRAFGSLLLSVVAGHLQAESLLDIYQTALQKSPAYLAAIHERDASSEVYKQARSYLLPQLNASYVSTDTQQDIVSSDNTVFASGSTNFPSEDTTISLSQSIYSYTNWARFSQSKIELQRIDADFAAVQQDLIVGVADAYFAALAANEDYNSIEAEVRAVKEHYELVKAKRADGLVRETELLDAKARYYQSMSRQVAIQAELKDALQGLRQLTGEEPGSLNVPADEIPLKSPSPENPEEWLKTALEYNPELQAARKAVDVALKEMKIQQGGHYPTLDLQYNMNSNVTEGTLFGGGSEVDTTEMRLALNIPLYAGGLVSSKVREARARYEKAQQEYDQLLRELRRQIFSGFSDVMSDISKVESLKMSVQSYELAVEAKRLAFRSGLATGLAVLDAERDLFFARTEFARARFGYLINTLRLKRSMGLLTVDDLKEIDRVLTDERTQQVAAAVGLGLPAEG